MLISLMYVLYKNVYIIVIQTRTPKLKPKLNGGIFYTEVIAKNNTFIGGK